MATSEKKCAVYIHKFPNGKVYIGITTQKVEVRWQKGNGYVRNPLMAKAIKKYGWDNIEHIIVSEGMTVDRARELECALIKQHQANKPEHGYNIESGGQYSALAESTKEKLRQYHIGLHPNDATREKMRKSRLEYLEENEQCRQMLYENMRIAIEKAAELKRKPVEQYDRDGNLIAVWASTREAERVLGIQHSHISKCCMGKPKYNTAGGYRWKYADE